MNVNGKPVPNLARKVCTVLLLDNSPGVAASTTGTPGKLPIVKSIRQGEMVDMMMRI